MDTATSDIRAVEFTSSDGDSPVLPELLDQFHDGEETGICDAAGDPVVEVQE